MLTLLMSKIKNLLSRGIINRIQSKEGLGYSVGVSSFGRNYSNESYYPYGYTANPPLNSYVINLFLSGQPESGISLPYDPTKYWEGVEPGEVQIGNPLTFSTIKFSSNGDIVFNGNVRVNGNLTTTGEIGDSKGTLDEFRQIYNQHVHPVVDVPGNTGIPLQPAFKKKKSCH